MKQVAHGGVFDTITRDTFGIIECDLPPLSEQRAIAHILGTLDDKIELNRRMSETLEAMARALFKSWFVDFDPVRAKAEGRDPGLPQPLADLFPDSFEDSELGEIPKGWEVGVVADLAEVSSGKRPNVRFPEESEQAAVPLWGGNGPMAFVPEALVDEPILLTGRVGTLGSVFRIMTPCWPSDNTLVLRANQQAAFEYLFLQLQQIDFASLNRGSTQPLLTQTDLKAVPLLLPEPAVLERFSVFSHGLYKRVDEAVAESRTLAALRDALLPKLISGEMRVKDAERFLKERAL
jgi:type I restriction enzyme S subunit